MGARMQCDELFKYYQEYRLAFMMNRRQALLGEGNQ